MCFAVDSQRSASEASFIRDTTAGKGLTWPAKFPEDP